MLYSHQCAGWCVVQQVTRYMSDKGLFDHSDRVYLEAQAQSEKQRQEAQQKQEQEQLALFRVQSLKPPAAQTLNIPTKPSKLVADKPLSKIVIRKRVQANVKKQPTKRPKLDHEDEDDDAVAADTPMTDRKST